MLILASDLVGLRVQLVVVLSDPTDLSDVRGCTGFGQRFSGEPDAAAIFLGEATSVEVAVSLVFTGFSRKVSDFFLRSFLFSCLRLSDGLLLLAFGAVAASLLSSWKTKEFSIFADMENLNPLPASMVTRSMQCFKGEPLSQFMGLTAPVEFSILSAASLAIDCY